MFEIVSFHTLGQAYYSPNILLNLEIIFKFDNKKLMHEEPDNPPYTSCKVQTCNYQHRSNLNLYFSDRPEDSVS